LVQPGFGNSDLESLVRQAQRGDRVAFERVVQGTARLVYAQIVGSVRDRQKAEDLTQETFLAAWKGIGSVQEAGGFRTWLLTLARNVVLDAAKFEGRQKRGAGRLPMALEDGERSVGAEAPGPEETVEAAEARERALVLLEELPEEYRQPLKMRYLAGADYAAIREQLGLSDGALRGMLARGMALLRERMTRMER
jgi:RNA polymerase sigma-70 factor (ECF subfamily)